jgi:hypothetical protein
MALVMFLGSFSYTQAQLISDRQVEEQKREVFLAIVDSLQEHVKLLQMILIQRLEAQVNNLETLIANQNK